MNWLTDHRNRSIFAWSGAVILLIALLILFSPSQRVFASAGITCDGRNLKINWSGLNTPVSIEVNGSFVITNGGASGSHTISGPGSWTVTIYEFGDTVGTYSAKCGKLSLADNPAFTSIAYELDDNGFDLYIYDPAKKAGSLAFSMTCLEQTAAAVRSQKLHLQGRNANVLLYSGKDAASRPVSVYFVYPDQIQVNGYFSDGKPHSYSFAACVSALAPELYTHTPMPTLTPTPSYTPTPRPPNITLTASCTIRGNATYRITNTGGAMVTNGNWEVFANGTRVGGDTFRASAGSVVTITSSGVYGNITFSTSGGGTNPQSISTFCVYPTATPTRTPTFTPVPPNITLTASCTIRGNATYRITNTGGSMLTTGNWVVYANGTRVGGDTFRASAGSVVTITSSGVYGNITFSTSGGGTNPQSISTFCVYPTATRTRTPTLTPTPQ